MKDLIIIYDVSELRQCFAVRFNNAVEKGYIKPPSMSTIEDFEISWLVSILHKTHNLCFGYDTINRTNPHLIPFIGNTMRGLEEIVYHTIPLPLNLYQGISSLFCHTRCNVEFRHTNDLLLSFSRSN